MATITEGLAEIKTIGKRIEAKRSFVMKYLHRQELLKDPLAKDGGSAEVVKRELQAIDDLEQRIIDLRAAIAAANVSNDIEIKGVTRPISEWLTWKREVANERLGRLRSMSEHISKVRREASTRGLNITKTSTEEVSTDVVVNVDELQLSREIETAEEILGYLDGQLSLSNATIQLGL